jgi:DNA-binding NtrC family response regulator
MQSKILLFEKCKDLHWHNAIEQAANSLGQSLETGIISELEYSLDRNDYSLIVFDATNICNLSQKIKQIHIRNPDARIIVFSSAPEWKEATEVMIAGAMDYQRKYLGEKYIYTIFKRNLSLLPPKQDKILKRMWRK